MLTASVLFDSESRSRARNPFYRVFVGWTSSDVLIEETRNLVDANVLKEFEDRSGGGVVGSFTLQLKNDDARFSYFNQDSPLAGYVTVGKHVVIQAGFSGEGVTIFTGEIRSITNNPKTKEVTLNGNDGMDDVLNKDVRSPMLKNNTLHQILHYLGNAAGVDVNKRSFEPVTGTIPFYWSEGNVGIEMQEAAEIEGGRVYFDEEGNFIFKNRYHDYASVSPSVVIAYDRNLMDLKFDVDSDSVINYAEVKYYTRKISKNVTLWEHLGDTITILAGQTFDIISNYESMITAGFEFTANSAIDGSGSNLTGVVFYPWQLDVTPTDNSQFRLSG